MMINKKINNLVSILAILFVMFLTSNIKAAIPIPSGFRLILSDTGVKVYQKDYAGGSPDYVTILDLRYGTLRNFTGNVSGPAYSSLVSRRTIQTFLNDAVSQNTSTRKVKVVVNGTFFSTNDNPAGIAFGLKADWWRMSYGYGLNEYPGLIRTFAYDSSYGSSSIQNYSRTTFDGGIPNVIGGLDPSANKQATSYIARTFVGVRDDNNDGNSETVFFFSSSQATQAGAVSILNSFGAGSKKVMLDGGGSTGLIINGTTKINPVRTLPQVFVICAGK